jgi:signal transduction histidine kinase
MGLPFFEEVLFMNGRKMNSGRIPTVSPLSNSDRSIAVPALDDNRPAVVVLDALGRVIHMDAAAESLLHVCLDMIRGKVFEDFFFRQDDGSRDTRLPPSKKRTALRAGHETEFESADLKLPDGDRLSVLMRTMSFATDGNSFSILLFRSASEMKKDKKLLFQAEKMNAFEQIVSGIVHEINNPNNFISFNIPILQRYWDEITPILDRYYAEHPQEKIFKMSYKDFIEDIAKLMENMENGSMRITEVVTRMRKFIRSDDEGRRRPESISNIIRNVMAIAGKSLHRSLKNVDILIEPDLPQVLVDVPLMEQMILDLLLNAAQAADKPNSSVRLLARTDPDSGEIELVIEDNGCGIAQSMHDAIFNSSFSTKSHGTGLGLTKARSIVENHGGKILLESTPGEGTRMTIRLPTMQEFYE